MKRTQLLTTTALTLALSALVAVPQYVRAQTPSPSSSASAELRRVIRERIEQTLAEDEIQQPQFIGTLGTITQVGTSTFTIVNSQGRERTIQVLPTTVMQQQGKNVKITDLAIQSGAAVIGRAIDDVVIEARRVIVTTDAFVENRQVALGTIMKIGPTSLSFQRRGTSEDQAEAFLLTRNTRYEDSLGNTLKLSDIEEAQAALLIVKPNANNQLEVIRLRLLVPMTQTSATPSSTAR